MGGPCADWAVNRKWGALKEGGTLAEACAHTWAKDNCARTCCKQAADERYPGGIDFAAFYLDDGIAAGSDQAVALFCSQLKWELADARRYQAKTTDRLE